MSFLAVFFYVVVGAASILAGIDAGIGLRGARRPVTVAVLVLAIGLLLSLLTFPLHGLVLLVALTALLLIGLIVEFATAGAGRRRLLTIVAAVITVLALLSLWPVVGLTVG
jgi:hypothetical protein